MTEETTRLRRRQRSLHCAPAEQAMIRERAAEAGKTVSRHVLDLALADDPDRHCCFPDYLTIDFPDYFARRAAIFLGYSGRPAGLA